MVERIAYRTKWNWEFCAKVSAAHFLNGPERCCLCLFCEGSFLYPAWLTLHDHLYPRYGFPSTFGPLDRWAVPSQIYDISRRMDLLEAYVHRLPKG